MMGPVQQTFSKIAPRYDLLNDLISFRMHRRWKKSLVRSVLEARGGQGDRWLDVAAGTGDVCRAIQRERPGSKVVAFDPSAPMMCVGKGRAPMEYQWVQGVSEQLPFGDGSFDALTSAFGVRNFRSLPEAFAEWRRVLVPGGVAGILEVHPIPQVWYRGGIELYWRAVPWLGRQFGMKDEYEYLRTSSRGFLTAEGLVDVARKSGFRPIGLKPIFAKGWVSLTLYERPNGK